MNNRDNKYDCNNKEIIDKYDCNKDTIDTINNNTIDNNIDTINNNTIDNKIDTIDNNNINNKMNVTTHNLFFHDNASIFSIDNYKDIIVTVGGDKALRVWRVHKENNTDITLPNPSVTNHPNPNCIINYYTAINSNIKIEYINTYNISSTGNCVRINKEGIIACTDDNGYLTVIPDYMESESVSIGGTGEGGEIEWIDNRRIVVGYSTGRIALYSYNNNKDKDNNNTISNNKDNITNNKDNNNNNISNNITTISNNNVKKIIPRVVENKCNINLLHSLKLHSNSIVGLTYTSISYNNRNILVSIGRDKTVRIVEIKDNKLLSVGCIKHLYYNDHSIINITPNPPNPSIHANNPLNITNLFVDDKKCVLFRRIGFSPSNLLFLCSTVHNKKNSVHILHYPYSNSSVYGIIEGFDSVVIKVIFSRVEDRTYFLTRTSCYVCMDREYSRIIRIENFTFRMITDGVIVDDILMCTAVDGFLTSLEIII